MKENAFISLFCLRLLKFYPFKEIFIFAYKSYNYYFVKRLLENLLRIFVETNDTLRRIIRYERTDILIFLKLKLKYIKINTKNHLFNQIIVIDHSVIPFFRLER